jgi:heterodisulfide reductase subunit A
MMAFGSAEYYYKKSQEIGVTYIKFANEKPPSVEERNGKLVVTVYDEMLGREIEIGADKLVLGTPQVPPDGTEELQKILKVPLSPDGFFMEAHAKLRPLEFTSDGIFLCGSCQSPKELSSIIAQASGAASKACSLLSKGAIETEAIIAQVEPELCIGCGRCEEVCEYKAIRVSEVEKGIFVAQLNEGICKGCGACAVACPTGAISARHFTDEQIIAMIEAIAEG